MYLKFSFYLAIALIFFSGQPVSAQKEKKIVFKLNFATDTTSVDGIDWQREKPTEEFKLRGTNVKYQLRPLNDSLTVLYRGEGKSFVLQEIIRHTFWTMRRVEDGMIFSEFKLVDFNKDGYEDLLCWTASNVNGNEWTLIYLYDPEKQKLVKLYNNADHTDIWDMPRYNPKNSTIKCELFSSAYGYSSESIFKLKKIAAYPLKQTCWDSTHPDVIITKKYIGLGDKWKLISTTRE